MKERLSKFLKEEKLTPSKLADIIGVQPSGISHLLSGRNKPGFDFIFNLLSRFPRLNPYWLILGIEPMYNDDVRHTNGAPVSTLQSAMNGDIERSEMSDMLNMPSNSQATHRNELIIGNELQFTSNQMAESPIQSNDTQQSKDSCTPQPQKLSTPSNDLMDNNTIERVILLMRDGSFTSYTPNK